MPFDPSQLKVLDQQPWRWTTQPAADGTGGVKQTLGGVFILLSDDIVTYMRATMTAAEKTEIAPWVERVSTESPLPAGHTDAGLWHVPMWAGETRAVVLHFPASIWASPTDPVPLKIKTYFRALFREA